MSLYRYSVDLRSFSPDERARIIETIKIYGFSSLEETQIPFVYEVFLDESEKPESIPALPLGSIRRIP